MLNLPLTLTPACLPTGKSCALLGEDKFFLEYQLVTFNNIAANENSLLLFYCMHINVNSILPLVRRLQILCQPLWKIYTTGANAVFGEEIF